MIRIDRLLFGFVAADEQFTQRLYADWDSFCRTCVEEVLEKSLSAYDREKVLHEIELLDLDLGSIPEEDFYREYPQRLREELRKALPLLTISVEILEKNTAISRLENLLFYLEHGYPKAEWSDESFNLTEELEWIVTQPSACINKITKLCLSKEYVLRRLLWQTDNKAVLLRLYTAALSEPVASLYEKRRFLIMFLEIKPDIPVSFIHETESNTGLLGMAELLDSASVWRIMETEAGEHTEVDLPPYWHYLYEWLIRYYPFNGLAIFGSKGDFTHHLHYRLLTFIHKQTYSFYYSKEELTVGFLLEVFGPTYYIEVLNAIYDLQPHHPDGSPMYDSYFNRELYRMFLNLSLLRLPLLEKGKEILSSEKEEKRYPPENDWKSKEQSAVSHEASSSADYIRKLQTILLDRNIPETVKRRMIASYLEQYAGNYMDVILMLHKENLLAFAVHLISQPALEEIIRQSLFVKENIHTIIALIFGESNSNIVQTLLENCWNTDKGFINWLEDTTISPDSQRELLQKMAVEKPLDWIHLLRKQSRESKVIPLLSASLSASLLLQSMTQVNFHQASVLLQTVEWIQNKINDFPFLTRGNIRLSTALSQALLLYMQNMDTSDKRTFTKEETKHKFLSYLYLVYSGKSNYQKNTEWTDLSVRITTETKWDNWQPERMEDYFFSRLFLENNTLLLSVAELSDSNLPEGIRKRLLNRFIYSQPKELLDYIRQSVERSRLSLNEWMALIDLHGWMRLATNLSLSQAELLQQIINYLSESDQAKETDLQQALATCLIRDTKKWIYNNKEEAVYSFVQSLPSLQEKTEIEKKEIEHNVKQILNIMEGKSFLNEEQNEIPYHFSITNAGLCLFGPWFPQLFSMLNYMTEDRRAFKDTVSQIRAVFLLQYLACLEEKEYRETDLVFNRLIVGLPMHIPLPKQIELTQRERDVAESLQKGIKINWRHMQNTSTLGFLQNFVLRNGRLNQQEDKWLLTVEERGVDVLLDTIPWSFKLMHYPWLKKHIQIVWHEKQYF